MTEKTCKERWEERKTRRVSRLEQILGTPEFHEYGLSFDYVSPRTFENQEEGYWVYLTSWGGPSDEFRFYSSGPEFTPYRIEYWFLDWFDGHGEALSGKDEETLLKVWDYFSECGTTLTTFEKSAQDF